MLWDRFNLHRGRYVTGLLLILLLGLVAGCTPAPDITRQPGPPLAGELPAAPEVGRLAPDFTLTDLEGNTVSLSGLRGKTVFLNFWATWCPPCREEMPEIEAVYQQYREQGVVVIGVDLLEPEEDVLSFVREGGYSWTFVIDTTGAVGRRYGVNAIPASFFVDKNGVIRSVQTGPMSRQRMASHLAAAME